MNTEFMNSITRSFNKVNFQLKKYSPQILVTAGVIGTVTSAVMACKATTKIDSILNKTKHDISDIHEAIEHPENLTEEYTVEDSKKDLAIVYAHTGIELLKLYGPSLILGTASIASIFMSHNILRKRNLALAAAYTTVDSSFKSYRNRVVERFGKELDRELKYDIKAKEIKETVVDEEGKKKTVKNKYEVTSIDGYSDYSRFFDDGCIGWTKDPEINLMTLRSYQNYANDLLKTKGYLFLNDVYDILGIQHTRAGQIVGWMYDEKNPKGDNFVDFGIYDVHKEGSRNFVNGIERTILLDFNVDGNILDLI